MDDKPKRQPARAGPGTRSVTIKDLARELDLSITTISRALNGYADVGEKTRQRVAETAEARGYRPNRNAQRLARGRTHNIAWVQPANERKYLDPHFVEVMAGVLRGALDVDYDIVMTSHTPEREIATYDRYVNDNSVDGFIVDLPRDDDPRISYLLQTGRPVVVHGRESRHPAYGWVDIDNYGNFYRLARLMIANGHRHIAFINGDEQFNYALYRRHGVVDALVDNGLGPDAVTVYNSRHPMGDAGYRLTRTALEDRRVTALIYSSVMLALEGNAALGTQGERGGRPIAVASMDDELRYLDLSRIEARVSLVRSSLTDAGTALIEELSRQCDRRSGPHGTLIPSRFDIRSDLDGTSIGAPLPPHRRNKIG
jgi:LacI family transcriptional regulator